MDWGPARVSGADSAAAAGTGSDVRETEGTGVLSEDAMGAGATAPGRSGCRSVAGATARTGTAYGGPRPKPGGKEWQAGEATVAGGKAGKVDRGKAALGAACWRVSSGATGRAEGRAHAVMSDAVRTAEWPGDA